MDFALTDEDIAFRDELRAWLDAELPRFLADWSDAGAAAGGDRRLRPHAGAPRRDWQRRLDDGRWAAINWPRDWHGREATPVQNAIYAEEMARVKAPGIYNANGIWQIGPMILQWGTARAAGSAGCPGSSRPRSTGARGSASPRPARTSPTCARSRSPTATTTSSNGQKTWISSAHLARWGLFLLRTDPTAFERGAKHEGITAFIVDLAHARHRVPADPRHHRRHDAQRGVLHRRGRPGRLPARRRGRGLAGRDEHARPRARRHRRPVDHDGRRSAGDGRRGARR